MEDSDKGVECSSAITTRGTADDVVLELVAGKADGRGCNPC